MAQKRVMIQLHATPQLHEAAAAAVDPSSRGPAFAFALDATPQLDGVALDPSFPLTPLPSRPSLPTNDFAATPEGIFTDRYLVRGLVEESDIEAATAAVTAHPNAEAMFADPVIEPCMTCISSAALGTYQDVAQLLAVPQLQARGMTGEGVLLAIVDTGFNLPYLRSKGLEPNFHAGRSWIPPSAQPAPPLPPLVPGNLPVDHGTMCAFDALIAAPKATLLDIAVLRSATPGGSAMSGLLSDAVLAYAFLYQILTGPRRPGDFQSMVVSNSWGMFRMSWDFPVGSTLNYSDNAKHPFNQIVGTLEAAGADILFAAGNCGHECPDGRCGTDIDAGIYGANSHPQVLSIAGVDINKNRVGYSTRGPGHLFHEKPDVSGFTHFRGSGVYPSDGGTSAATPVVAGLVAAFRSRFPNGPAATPGMVRSVLTRTAEDRGTLGFDLEYGWGVVNGTRLASLSSLSAESAEPATPSTSHKGEQPMTHDDAFMKALAAFEQGEARPAAMSPVDLCSVYAKVKPVLQGILPFIELIPRIGKPAAAAIKALMAGLDSLCGGTTQFPIASRPLTTAAGDQSFMEALAAFEQPTVTTSASISDLCGIYKTVRPILNGLLPFICLIPSIGQAVCAAITALMAALDAFCPAM